MKCIKVYPILKKTFADSLTYWIHEDVVIGDIIQAPLQSRNIWVVVDSIISVNEAKEFIKSQTFAIRKITQIKKLDLFSQNFVFSVLTTAHYFAKPFGEVFSELIPKKILESLEHDDEVEKINNKSLTNIDLFPIQEYIDKTILQSIVPIDLYKIDGKDVHQVTVHYTESEYYRHLFKKFDYRFFVEEFCKRSKIKLIKIKTKLDLKNKNLYIIDQNVKHRTQIRKKNLDNETYKRKLNLISPELFSALKNIEKEKKSVLLYTIKKGFASSVMCPDCHNVMKCTECNKPLSIEIHADVYVYTCEDGHAPLDIDTPCPICQNENLLPLGASIEVVYREIEKEFDIPIIKIDNENSTKGQVKKELEKIDSKTSAIFIGNDFLLNQMIAKDIQFDNVALISLESLFSIPLYSMEQEIYQKIALLSHRTKKNLLIQTRRAENPFWKHLQNNDLDAIENKIELKALNLPPYTTHIQIAVPTIKNDSNLQTVKKYLDRHVQYFETKEKLKTTIHILMDATEYTKSPIIFYLKSLPAYMNIEVDSRNLL